MRTSVRWSPFQEPSPRSGSHVLQEGDAFYFRASVSHRFENPGLERCSYLAIFDCAPLG